MTPSIRCLTAIGLLAWSGVANAQNCPPPPAHPFFEFQVERPATFIPDSTVSPYPAPPPPGTRARPSSLVSFVVDTLGKPDTMTYKVIVDDASGIAREGRAVFARWRYQPAQIRGCAVSQLVQTPLARR